MDWLNELKVGDRVAVMRGYARSVSGLLTVTRVTATLIICGNDRFRKSSGVAPGDGYDRASISEVTPEILVALEDRALRRKIAAAAEDKTTPITTLRAMYAAMTPPTPEAAGK